MIAFAFSGLAFNIWQQHHHPRQMSYVRTTYDARPIQWPEKHQLESGFSTLSCTRGNKRKKNWSLRSKIMWICVSSMATMAKITWKSQKPWLLAQFLCNGGQTWNTASPRASDWADVLTLSKTGSRVGVFILCLAALGDSTQKRAITLTQTQTP